LIGFLGRARRSGHLARRQCLRRQGEILDGVVARRLHGADEGDFQVMLLHDRLQLHRLPTGRWSREDGSDAVAAVQRHDDLARSAGRQRHLDDLRIGDRDDRIEALVHIVGARQTLAGSDALDAAGHGVAQIEQPVDAVALDRDFACVGSGNASRQRVVKRLGASSLPV
jgi:hypothetical protein